MISILKYSCCLLMTTLLFLMLYTHSYVATNDNHVHDQDYDLITSMCRRTPNPSDCELDIRLDPRSSKPNRKTIVLIIIDVVKFRFSEALTYARDVAGAIHDDPAMIRALNKCIECYSFVVNVSSATAKKGVETGQPKYALDVMNDASGEADACLKAFPGDIPTAFVVRTKGLKETSAIAVGLVKIIM